jgi:hypothetical protein
LAQVEIGRPYDHFARDMPAEILIETDPLGLRLLRGHWPNIDRVAQALLLKGHLSENEVHSVLESKLSIPIKSASVRALS